MNLYSIIALIMSVAVLLVGLKLSSDDLKIFWDVPSIFIVVGGSIAATSISFQLNRLVDLSKILFQRIILGKKHDYKGTIKELMTIADGYVKGNKLDTFIGKTSDPFLKDALTLASDEILDTPELIDLLSERADNLYYIYSEDAIKIKTAAKYPPAFGMMGTTIGMIVLLANLGGADAIKKIGPAMGVCLITTLYGVVISNMAILPMGENLSDSSKETYLKNKIIVEGIRLILAKTNQIVLAEKLNSFLQPSDRLDWRKVAS